MIIFFLSTFQIAAGKNYYFSTSYGDDSRTPAQAQNSATPWKTINKLNSYFNSLLPGDSVLFMSGETFYGSIIVSKGGSVGFPIVITSYGIGYKPIISAFQTITEWSYLGGNIWESIETNCVANVNMVTIDGIIQPVGRYPNDSVLTYESFSGSTTITDNQLTNSPNWTNAEVVIRANPYNWVRYPVSNHTNTIITYSGSTYTDLKNNYGYFFQRDPKTLDLDGEWYFNPSTMKLRIYFAENNPTAHIVKASASDYVVFVNSYQNNKSFLVFNNIEFEGGNESNIMINGTSTNNIITHCTSNYSGKNGFTTSGAANIIIDNCKIDNSLSTGILHSGDNALITNNTLTNSGVVFGMSPRIGGSSGLEIISGTGILIQYNHVDSTGKHGIFLRGNNNLIKNNLVEYAALTHDDVGGIYTTGTYINSSIIENIILNTKGDKTGCSNSNISVEGIYLDAPHTGVYVDGNTVAHSGRAGLRYHNAWNVTARFNTLYDNPVNIMIVKSALGSSYSYNQTINNNISVCKESNQLAFWIYNYFDGNPLTFGTSDSNYFARPILDTDPIRTTKPGNDKLYTLSEWQSISNNDLNSKKSPIMVTDNSNILFEYNASTSNKTIPLFATYIGIDSTIYTNNITLLPYSSIILIEVPGNSYNQAPSIEPQGFQIPEGSPNSSIIGTVAASDPDAGQTLTYTILSGNTSGAFAINASSGVLTVANSSALNFESTPSFALIVKVQDNGTGTLSSQATATVSLTNINEVPVMNNQAFSIAENSANGNNIGTVISSDPDAGQILTYSIFSGNTSGTFAINASSGALAVANSSALNFETTPSFALVVKVQDNGTGTLSSQATVTISLTNINEVPVIINQGLFVAENATNGTNVGTVVASDPDAGQILTYSILSGNTSGAFAINPSTGMLTIANSSALNFEVTPSFALAVKVQDNGIGTLSSQATVTVSLTNINEVPVISNQAFAIAENSANGTNVGTVLATDPDAGQILSYSILSGNTSGAFAINPSTGMLMVANSSALNFETIPSFTLVVKVQDNGTGTLSSQATVTVSLIDINDAPQINNQNFTVDENTTNGTRVYIVGATDEDAGQVLAYSILSGNTFGAFTINSSSGEISVANSDALNFENNPSFALSINVQDNGLGNLSSQSEVTVLLSNINEIPVINNQMFPIAENSVNGTSVGTVIALDPDAGQELTFSILSGNTSGAFVINENTGIITVSNPAPIDFETNPYFNLVVEVQDNGIEPTTSQATVTISLSDINEAPVVNNQTFDVTEFTVNGTSIGTVIANDPDAGQVLSYLIIGGNIGNAFSINSTTGEITVANSTALNYSVNPIFSLNVKVTDNGTGNLFEEAIITINILQEPNLAPIINNQTFAVTENSTNGTNVGTVVATDPDAGQILTYSILSGNTSGAFAINPSTGALTVANSSALNFESTPSLALIVKVQDNGTGTLGSQATVTISLNDINETPVVNNQTFDVFEFTINGTSIGSVIASDPDAGQVLSYLITGGNIGNAFSINSTTGEIIVANSTALNYSVNPIFTLNVKVTDNGAGNLFDEAIMTINVHQEPNQSPVISNQAFNVAENSANGTTVGTVVATDPDAGQILTYSILSGNTSGAFAINPFTGVLTVANSSALNFESTPSFALIVKVQDNGTGTLSSQATATVSLTNINEVPVINNQAFSIAENSANGNNIGTVISSDPDAGQTLTYSILSGNTSGAFAINASTGVLTVANSLALNFETSPSFALVVKVQDNGTGTLSSQATVIVSLTNINEVPIINNQIFTIAENSANGSNVGTVVATDPDAGQILTYSILSGNTSGAFAINASTGALAVANSSTLNFETTPSFALVVKVQDNGTGTLSSQATVTVSLSDINETPVVNNQSFDVFESAVNGTSIGTVIASDPDAGQVLSYLITGGNIGNAFSINSTTGEIIVANSTALNYSVNPIFILNVKVTDNGAGNLFEEAIITINILQEPNLAPIINNQAFAVTENSTNGTNVGTVVATDPDAGQILTYSILSGNTSGAFAINDLTGVLTVANSLALNFETSPSFALVVKVQDNGTGTLSSQATVTVSLSDVNETPVVNNQSFDVFESAVNGTSIGTVIANDPDAGQVLSYLITDGNTGNAFSINSTTGEIIVANSTALNYSVNPIFSLNVKVTDNGAGNLFDEAIMTINVLQEPNQSPVISNQAFAVAENSTTGTTVGTVVASDPDAGQILTYSILSGNTSGAFAINALTGVLTVANSSALNFEVNPSFAFVVKVQDNGTGTLSSQATVTVSLTNTNEVPVINNQAFSVAENSANGTNVGTVVASDQDAGQILTYSILSGNTSSAFAINPSTGVLTVANSSALNFETTPSFALVVKVQDNGTGTLSSQATVTVSLTNVNEVPVISNQAFPVTENSANGTNVGTVVATDPDAGQILTYAILSGNTSGVFAISASTGALTVANSSTLNFETTPSFALVVKVQDNGTGTLSSQATVTISLTDINEVPVINNQIFTIAENSANGSNVGTVVASDPDAGQTLSYSILSGNTSGAFSINASTGVLTVANSSALNFETTPSFALVVKVQDNGTGTLSNQAMVTVSLSDINETPVVNNQTFDVFEFTINGTSIGSVIASDPDAGQVLSYLITGGNIGNAFSINSTTGEIIVANSTALNYSVNPIFSLNVKVTDNGAGDLFDEAIMTINVLQEPNQSPVISNQAFAVTENSTSGTNVGTVVATDPDAGQILTYSILSGNTSGAFAINALTGVLTVANSSALNFEVNPSFALVVKVQDNGTGTLSSQATVTVSLTNTNEVPVINNQIFSVAENSANGTYVGIVVATDPDAGQTLSYSILSGNTSGAFAINPSTGVLTVANSSTLNFESTPSFALIVKVQDNGTGTLSNQATVTISLTNINEVPFISNQAFAIAENSANGTIVGTVVASDPDAGQTLTYSILSGNTSGAFAINASTGELAVANSSALNFETTPSFALVVKVQDNGTGTLSNQATVTVSLTNTNEAPVINNQIFSVAENSANGTNVGTVVATDPDAGQILTYSILSGNTSGAFAINASTGALAVASSTLNFETTPSFALVVKVQDNGTETLSSQATVTVSLSDVNETPVVNNQSFDVFESAVNGTSIGTVVASDPDAAQVLSYLITDGNTGNAFSINSNTGEIIVSNSTALNYSVNPIFSLNVKVTDNGAGNLFDEAIMTINVLQEPNQSPVISNQVFAVTENSTNGTNVGTVVATDPDAGQILTYSILSGNTSGAFTINPFTGVLTVANSSALNFESIPSFALIVKVQDNGTGTLSNQATVTVSLTNSNEVPVINNQIFSVVENSANGSNVGTVVASDPDAGQTLSYSIISSNTSGAFTINPSTGVLTVANTSALNFETTPSFALVVKVQDNGTVTLSSQATVTVSLTNINEVPVINNQAFSVAENSANGSNVGTVVASDPDAGQILTYSILSGNSSDAFALNPSGVLTVANSAALNFEITPSFALVVKVQDNGTGTLSSQATVTVSLTNINEVPVINDQTFYVAENSANGTNVGTVVATDPDPGQTLTYSILSGNTSGAFAINASTGVVTVANSSVLNFETNPSFSLVVKVQDNGIIALSSQAVIALNLVNANEAPVVANQLFIINENSSNGTLVGTFVATDPDAGQTLAYSILSGNVSNDFVINATTGVISVANSSALNFEENSSFALLINVQDNGAGNLNSQAIATVSLTDVNEAPLINNQFFTVAENSSIGTSVGTVVSSDPDAGQLHVYSIISGNEDGTFIISATSGIITIANTSALNFEENPSFAFVVKVQDNGAGNLSSQATINVSLTDVNENPSVDNQTFNVYEFVQNGTEVGTVQATDPDAGQILSYTITAGNTNNAFAINSATGLITTLNSAAISYLNNPVFNLMVRISDNGAGNLFDDCIITIHVLPGINQPPVINDQTFFMNENSINGTSVGFVEAYDPDAGQTINYSILSGNTADAYTINSITGEITVSNSLALNYNTNPVFTLTVNVQDNGTLSLEDQATVTINLLDTNEPPVITDQLFSTTEHQPVGTQVCSVVASGSGSGNSLSYSIEAGNIGNGFAINSFTGNLTISNPNAVCYEGNPEFDLLVKVQDSEGLSAEAIVTVNVLDINENPVCNNQNFTIQENTLSNTIAGTVIATEPDFNQTLTYTIVSGNSDNAFSLNETNGLIKVNNSAALNYEENQVFTLVVSVQDNGVGNLITNSTITINLLDINEYPVFENQVFDVVENSATGTQIGYLSASDPDAGQSVIYNIIGGNENQTFTLNPTTGLLSVADPALLFFDLNPVYILTVVAQDNSTDSLVTLALVTINVIKEIEEQIIYIDPTNENDLSENGSIDHPYDSWEDFSFKNGSTYLQKRGTIYKSNNPIIISKKTNITIDVYGNGGNPVVINFQTAAHTFEFDNIINCIIRNLEIMSDQKGRSCIFVTGNESKSLTIENCILHDATFGVSSNSWIKDLKILNSNIYDTGLDGINADKFLSIEIRDCKISTVNQNWFSDPYAAGSCVNLNSIDGKVYIHKNELDHTSTGNMSVVRMNGIKMEGLVEYNTLSGNKISDNQCLNLSNSSGVYVVRYNTIMGGKTGVNVNSESVKIYYNQMIGNQVAVKVQQNKAALIMNNTFVANDNFAVESLTGSKVSATNNIFYLTPAAPKAIKYGGSFVSDFNLFNIEKSGFLNGYNTLASWIAASGQDKNSQVKDPQFENGAEGNFRIKPNSPCINKGSDLKLEKDFFGTKVPQAGKPDIGFCEVENGTTDPNGETIPLVDLNNVIDLTVYPNPTTGILNIDLEKVIEQEVKIRIINMNGYQIYSTVSQGQKEVEIDLRNEKSGMYVVHFLISGMEFTKTVVVKRE